ncbi:hypothetical protein BS17DRAFT_764787 [Gyrodon lividus]|nr:hypothetical protein BS17DRAFT_764787 [Gyrodon lividus]
MFRNRGSSISMSEASPTLSHSRGSRHSRHCSLIDNSTHFHLVLLKRVTVHPPVYHTIRNPWRDFAGDATTITRSGSFMHYSGRAVHTPQILLLSGIGPASHFGKVVLDSLCVDENLSDHPIFTYVNPRLKDKLGISLDYMSPYNLTSGIKSRKAFTHYQMLEPDRFRQISSCPDAPGIKIIAVPMPVEIHSFAPEEGLHCPTSVGNIKLKPSNPWDNPPIDRSNLHLTYRLPSSASQISTQHNLDVLVCGIHGASKIAHTSPFSSITDVGSTHPCPTTLSSS